MSTRFCELQTAGLQRRTPQCLLNADLDQNEKHWNLTTVRFTGHPKAIAGISISILKIGMVFLVNFESHFAQVHFKVELPEAAPRKGGAAYGHDGVNSQLSTTSC